MFPDLSDYHVFSPRSMRPSITFPLAPPTTSNILAICQYSNQRPQYPKETLPTSGFGREHRQAMSVNQLESWYSVCCANGTQDVKQTLCCAQQAVRTPSVTLKISVIPKTANVMTLVMQ